MTKKYKTIKEHIAIAEQLAKDNNGILPSQNWLRNNNYIGLYCCIIKFPEKFKHIEQEKKFKTIEEQVVIAQQLAKDNNGILPSPYWLKNNGYSAIEVMIRRHPEKFKHIEQKKKISPIEKLTLSLKKFKIENKRMPSSSSRDREERDIYKALWYQRRKHKKNKLSEYEINLLSEIDDYFKDKKDSQ